MTFNPVPKPQFKRSKPFRRKRGEFSKEVREQIIERDDGLCRVCRNPATEIHHCRFRSQQGRGVFSNGILVCTSCHIDIHKNNEKAQFWRDTMERIYGKNYYKDSWDLE